MTVNQSFPFYQAFNILILKHDLIVLTFYKVFKISNEMRLLFIKSLTCVFANKYSCVHVIYVVKDMCTMNINHYYHKTDDRSSRYMNDHSIFQPSV